MDRNVTTVIAVALVSLLAGSGTDALADERQDSILYRQASLESATRFVAVTGNSLLPKRWRLEMHMTTPSQAMRLASDPPPGQAALEQLAPDFDLSGGYADRSALRYQLADLKSDRLVTFWKGNSLGIFLGVTRGGYISLSIAQ